MHDPTKFSSRYLKFLTHWGWSTHIWVSKHIIGSDNGLSPDQCQAITWTNVGILLTGPLGTIFQWNLNWVSYIFIQENAFENAVCKMRPFSPSLIVLKRYSTHTGHPYKLWVYFMNPMSDLCSVAVLAVLYAIHGAITYQMGPFPALLALREGNPPVTGGFPSQRPVTHSFDVFFYLCQNKCLNKQLRCWWFETPLRSIWCNCDDLIILNIIS